MATVQEKKIVANDRLLIGGLSWEIYAGIRELLRDNPVRLTYCEGMLEFMTISREHEQIKALLASLLIMLALEMGMDMDFGGSLTLQLKQLERGLEPDECFWIEHEAQMRERDEYDPEVDPPPDLAIEVEISRGLLNRREIYERLRVPELWRYDGESLRYLLLGPNGYTEGSTSRSFPFLPAVELARFLALRNTLSKTAIVREFRTWVLAQIASGTFPSPTA
jgi:Uma2 family endonuclease